MDRDRLAKLMAMTTSTNDNEALSALRMANAMISKEKQTWPEILAGGGSTINIALHRAAAAANPYQTDEWVAPHLRDKVTIDLMFRAVFSQPRTDDNGGVWDFLTSIHARWIKHGNLSQGQYSGLKRCYQRVTRTAGAV